MPVKILSLSTVYPNPSEPGLGLFVQRRLVHLGALAQVTVLVPLLLVDYRKRVWNQAIARERTDGGITVRHPRWFYLPGTGALTAFALGLQMIAPVWRIHRSREFDVMDAHFGFPEGVAAALLAGLFRVPFAITMRGSELLHSRYRLRRLLMTWAFGRASRVFAVSHELGELAGRLGAHAERVRVVPNGIDTAVFRPMDRQRMRARLGVPPGRKVILTAGHLIELKGHHHAIAALRGLLDNQVDVELWIAGSGGHRGVADYEPTLRCLVSKLDLGERVRFLGQLAPAEMPECFSASDVFCLASSREGWPNVLNEALACGTPAVATRVGAVPMLIPSERFGLIVPAGETGALSCALRRALTRDWDREAIAARGRSRSWENVARDVLEELSQTVSMEGGANRLSLANESERLQGDDFCNHPGV